MGLGGVHGGAAVRQRMAGRGFVRVWACGTRGVPPPITVPLPPLHPDGFASALDEAVEFDSPGCIAH